MAITKLSVLALITFSTTAALAQQGDREDKVQPDVVPADLIPPSPLLNLNQALSSFEVTKGFVIEPVATGNQVHMPVALTFDEDGRAWVVEMTQYMVDLDGTRENKPTGRIKVLEDTTGDGVMDKVTIFLDHLVLPRAVAVTSDGLLYCHKDQLFFIKRNGLIPVGKPLLIDKNYAKGGNAEHKANGLLLARDNWYYNAKSNKRYRRIAGKWIIQKTNFRGQWGIAQDDAGRLFHNSNSNLLSGDRFRPNLLRHHPYFTPKHRMANSVGSSAVHPIRVTPGLNRAYTGNLLDKNYRLKSATAAAGIAIYRGQNFPKKYYGWGFSPEPGANLIKMIKIKRDANGKAMGSHPLGKKEFVASTDEWFRPVNLYTSPDGTLWVVDMYFGLIQHKAYMTSYLRKQYASRNLDKPMASNGRIYRVRFATNPISKVPTLSNKSVRQLIHFLTHPNGTVRDNAQRLITEKLADKEAEDFGDNITDWRKFIKSAIEKDNNPLLKIHALWVSESTGSISSILLRICLNSENPDVSSTAMELVHLSDNSLTTELLEITPTQQNVQSYLLALGKIATPQSHAKALKIINSFPKSPLIRQAYVSGLGVNAKKLTDGTASSKDKLLKKMIRQAANAKRPKKSMGPKGLTKVELKQFKHGQKLYLGAVASCAGCHGNEGAGLAGAFPPLAPSDWVTGDPKRLSKVLLHGLKGPITLNGKKTNFQAMMPGLGARADLSDKDLAAIMTYIRNMKGNKASAITADQVKKIREATKARNGNPYTEAELKAK